MPHFAANSVWNKALPVETLEDPSSTTLVGALAAEVEREEDSNIGPWIDTMQSSIPIYVASPEQAPVRVELEDSSAWWRMSLQAALAAVPIPAGAKPGGGNDRMMAIYQPSTGRLWELFNVRHENGVWSASWGGAFEHVSQSLGYYTTDSWEKAADYWGATATSLSLVAGTITLADMRAGKIEHALFMSLPYPRAGVYATPAERSDSTGTASSDIPEGARLRLPASLKIAALHLPHVTEMMALAAQKYGILVGNQTHYGISFYAQEPVPASSNPYAGHTGYFGGQSPAQLLASFPWSSLRVVKMTLRSG